MGIDHQMTSNEWSMFNHQKKIDKVFEKNRFYCYCGHSVVIMPHTLRVFCTYCGHWVYRDKRKQRKNIEYIKREDFKNKVKKNIKQLELKEEFRRKLKRSMRNVI